jgi:hypothetical protein
MPTNLQLTDLFYISGYFLSSFAVGWVLGAIQRFVRQGTEKL